jgi:hypothetical protein
MFDVASKKSMGAAKGQYIGTTRDLSHCESPSSLTLHCNFLLSQYKNSARACKLVTLNGLLIIEDLHHCSNFTLNGILLIEDLQHCESSRFSCGSPRDVGFSNGLFLMFSDGVHSPPSIRFEPAILPVQTASYC